MLYTRETYPVGLDPIIEESLNARRSFKKNEPASQTVGKFLFGLVRESLIEDQKYLPEKRKYQELYFLIEGHCNPIAWVRHCVLDFEMQDHPEVPDDAPVVDKCLWVFRHNSRLASAVDYAKSQAVSNSHVVENQN